MKASHAWQKRYTASATRDVTRTMSGDHLAKTVRVGFFDPEAGKNFRLEMTTEEAREFAAGLVQMADAVEKG
jgi:hypothetical protein